MDESFQKIALREIADPPISRITLTRAHIVAAFNEWMRQYIENPAKFEREWEVVSLFLREADVNKEPTYGDKCAEMLIRLIDAQ